MSSPKPPSKWTSRMGGVMRRASTVLTISRPGTPASERDSDSASLRRSTSREAVLSPPPPAPVSIPTPISESPAREAEAVQRDITGPSPLAQQDTLLDIPPVEAVVGSPVQPAVEERTTSPTGYIPPPVVDFSAGNPGAFTDNLEVLPQPDVIVDPYAATNTGPEPPTVEEPVAEPKEEVPVSPPFEAPAMEHSSSFFGKSMVESLKDSDSVDHAPSMPVTEAQSEPEPTAQDEQKAPQGPDHEHGEAASYYRGDPSMPIAEPHPVAESKSEEHHHDGPGPVEQGATHAVAPPFSTAVMPSFDLPSYMSQDPNWGGLSEHDQKPHDVWSTQHRAPPPRDDEGHGVYRGAIPISIPIPMGSTSGNSYHSKASSIRMPNPHSEAFRDPFADDVAPTIAVTHSEASHHPDVSEQHRQAPVETHDNAHGAVVMPLPAFHEVVPSNSLRHIPSHSSLAASNGGHHVATDERIPLLARPGTPNKRPNSYLQISHNPSPINRSSVSPLLAGTSSWNAHGNLSQNQPRLHDLGWLEYHLPDGSVYYVHPTRRVTTDLNLRVDRTLFAVDGWLEERKDETLDVGVEGWLREASGKKHTSKKASGGGWLGGKKKTEAVISLERFWVDHHARSVVKDENDGRNVVGYTRGHVHGHGGHGKGKKQAGATPKSDEDQLDLEYRFWSFMETHPAHTALPVKAKAEAMDVLNWAWTDRLLPSQSSIPPPFTQEECQELMTLLRSFTDDTHDDHGIQTRVVSRILLRVALWRQTYFRPNKPLPKDVGSTFNTLPVQRRPFRRVIFDFLVSCLCFGIPYLFLERARLSNRMDEESGVLRGASPMVIIGACTCLVAWTMWRGLRAWSPFSLPRSRWQQWAWRSSDIRQIWNAQYRI